MKKFLFLMGFIFALLWMPTDNLEAQRERAPKYIYGKKDVGDVPKVDNQGRLVYVKQPSYVVVDSLPESLGTGEVVLHNGTMWRGLAEGESSLDVGTPWPVKGYLEFDGWFRGGYQTLEFPDEDTYVIIDDFSAVINNPQYGIDIDIYNNLSFDEFTETHRFTYSGNVENIVINVHSAELLKIGDTTSSIFPGSSSTVGYTIDENQAEVILKSSNDFTRATRLNVRHYMP